MSELSKERSQEFLKISSQFKLGALTTESSHSVTENLSEVAKTDLAAALKLLFQADADVVKTFREFVQSGRAETIAATVLTAVKNGGKISKVGGVLLILIGILQLTGLWTNLMIEMRSLISNFAPVI